MLLFYFPYDVWDKYAESDSTYTSLAQSSPSSPSPLPPPLLPHLLPRPHPTYHFMTTCPRLTLFIIPPPPPLLPRPPRQSPLIRTLTITFLFKPFL